MLYTFVILTNFSFQWDQILTINIEILFNLYFLYDIFIYFWFSYFNDSNKEETNRKNIAIRYLKTFFILDFITLYPIIVIF